MRYQNDKQCILYIFSSMLTKVQIYSLPTFAIDQFIADNKLDVGNIKDKKKFVYNLLCERGIIKENIKEIEGIDQIDIFDFNKNNLLYNYCKASGYEGPSLYIAVSNLVYYSHFAKRTESQVIKIVSGMSDNIRESFIFSITIMDMFLYYWYLHFCPEKANEKHIQRIMDKYYGFNKVLVNDLYRKYVDKNIGRTDDVMGLDNK